MWLSVSHLDPGYLFQYHVPPTSLPSSITSVFKPN